MAGDAHLASAFMSAPAMVVLLCDSAVESALRHALHVSAGVAYYACSVLPQNLSCPDSPADVGDTRTVGLLAVLHCSVVGWVGCQLSRA